METFKFALLSVVVLTLLGLGGYWAVSTIQSGSEYVSGEKIKKLENANEALGIEIDNLKAELGLLQKDVKDEILAQPAEEAQTKVEQVLPNTASAFKYQELINELQKLISDNVLIRLKSRGTRVGTVQKFLNIYNDTTNKVDNDFGPGMKNDVIAFQTDQGLPGDGEAGKTTFSKMIDWLKKQG